MSSSGATDPTQSDDFKGKGKAAEHEPADATMDEDEDSSDDEQVGSQQSSAPALNFVHGHGPTQGAEAAHMHRRPPR